jgi:hypothetical protein
MVGYVQERQKAIEDFNRTYTFDEGNRIKRYSYVDVVKAGHIAWLLTEDDKSAFYNMMMGELGRIYEERGEELKTEKEKVSLIELPKEVK